MIKWMTAMFVLVSVFEAAGAGSLPGQRFAPECDGFWTVFFDRHDPSGNCKCETLDHLRTRYPGEICDYPTAIDAQPVSSSGKQLQTSDQTTSYYAGNMVGFACYYFGETCEEYRVRFCCPYRDFN